eukprot:gene44999-60959_t
MTLHLLNARLAAKNRSTVRGMSPACHLPLLASWKRQGDQIMRAFPIVLTALLLIAPLQARSQEPLDLTVMSFNIWGGGGNAGKSVDETVAVIKAVNPDIIGMQETRLEPDPCTAESCAAVGESKAKAIAEKLGYFYYDQSQQNAALWANAILS